MALRERFDWVRYVHIVYFLLILCKFCVQQQYRGNGENYDVLHNFPIFYSLDPIMKAIEEESSQHPEMVNMILDTYYNTCNMSRNVTPPVVRKKPFILIEGAYRSNRESLSGHIARRLDGDMIMMPPTCMAQLVVVLPRGTRIRTLFYALSNYVVSEQVKKRLESNIAVVMNGYWTDQTSFIIERRYMRTEFLPPKGDPLYDFPSDLVAPDLMFYVSYPFDRNNNPYTTLYPNYKTNSGKDSSCHSGRISALFNFRLLLSRCRKCRPYQWTVNLYSGTVISCYSYGAMKKLAIYERFRYPKMVEVSAESGFHHCVNRIYDNIFNLLGRKYDLSISPPERQFF